jgi:hypothetical protein
MTVAQAAGGNVALPMIDGRKTLLIGLGSTGTMVCNQILERLTWTYDSLDNVPWVKCLSLETAPVATEKMVRTQGLFEHLTIDKSQFSSLLANPQLYKDTLDFPDWNIPELIGTTDAVTDGANNTRILGRLALLFPNNFNRIQSDLSMLLQQLNTLTDQEASESLGRGLRHKVQVTLPSKIYVYVIGTLCGGTASGSFIDLGYMLSALPGLEAYHLTTTGIFMLPSPMSNHDTHIANAMAGLVELNHFSHDRTRYRAQYPNRPGVPYQTTAAGERPYRNLYLVQSRGASPEDYGRLVTTTADYIYSDVIGSSALVRDGARTNIAEHFVQRDRWGATQKYFTFGLSVVEFPYTKVLKGCTLRLAARGFRILLGSEQLTENATKTETGNIPLLNRKMLQEALLRSRGESLSSIIDVALANAYDKACQTDAAIDTVLGQIDAAFEGTTPEPLPQLPSRVVPSSVEENSRSTAKSLEDSIRASVASFLTGDNPRGMEPLLSLLNTLETTLAPKSGSRDLPLSELKAEMDTARSNIHDCRRDGWLKVVGQTRPAVKRYVDNFMDAAKAYYSRRLRDAAGTAGDIIYSDALKLVQALKRRITNETVGLRIEVQQIADRMDRLFAQTDVAFDNQADQWSRTINGTELFQSGLTIDQEYWSCLEETAENRNMNGDRASIERRLALGAAHSYFDDALEALFLSVNRTGRFDPDNQKKTPEYNDSDLLRMAFPARLAFDPLRNRSIIDRLLARADIGNILSGANTAADVFLDRQSAHPRYYSHPNKTYGYVFYNQNHPRGAEFTEQLRRAGVINATTKEKDIADPHQILILREEGAFSLGTLTQLRDEVSTHWWEVFRNPPGVSSLHARGDIKEWVGWRREDETIQSKARDTFLVALALDIICFESATKYCFEYKPTKSSDSGKITFSDDLDASARIMKSSNTEGMVKLRIAEWRKLYGSTEMVGKIDEFIKGSNSKFREADRRLTPQDIEVYLLDYLLADQELSHIYSTLFYENMVERNYRRDDEDGKSAYFCPSCNQKLGFSAESLYAYVNEGGRQTKNRKCTYCHEAIA